MTKPLEVSGAQEVQAGFDAVSRSVGDLTETHRGMVSRLVPEVRARTPRRTGDLGASWAGTVSSTAATISSPLDYALPVEVGTINMPGAHMVSDTLEADSEAIVKGYEDAIAAAATRAGFRVTR